MIIRLSVICATLFASAACGQSGTNPASTAAETPIEATVNEEANDPAAQSEALSAWFEAQWEAEIARSPESQTYLGRKTNYDKLDDASDAFAIESHNLRVAALADMRERFSLDQLSPEAQLSYRLFEYAVESEIETFPFRNHWYEFSQFRGPHSSIPSFFINQHRVGSVDDAQAYISRLSGVKAQMAQYRQIAEDQFSNGVHPPKWSYEKMLVTAGNLITGAPFDDSEADSTLRGDYVKKFEALETDEETKTRLIADADAAMISSVLPAYEELVSMFSRQMETAGDDDGAWKLPNGAQYYASQLKQMTTTDLSAAEIHALGLKEVARIHG